MRLLAGDFFKWILIADFLAVPVAYVVMRAWLGTFAYRTPVRISVFFISTGLILLTSALTVAQRLFKAARENPAASLRWE
jgi:putative ABC transport system permease protein